jgi:hypothetical protein
MANVESSNMDLQQVLEETAHRIADQGTQSESAFLEVLAAAARGLCPGAAAALVDWAGPEIVRLRAFGIVHGALLRELTSVQREALARRHGVPATGLAA